MKIMFYIQNISVYMNFGGYGGGDVISTVHFFLFKKIEKIQEYDIYLNQILHHFDLNFFSHDE